MLISCTPAEYRMALESLASLRATLERAASAPAGSKLHRSRRPDRLQKKCPGSQPVPFPSPVGAGTAGPRIPGQYARLQ